MRAFLQRWLVRIGLLVSGLVVGGGIIAATLITLALHHPTLHNQFWPYLQNWTQGQVSVQQSQGTLWRGLSIQHIQINTADIELQIDNLHWQWQLKSLFTGQLKLSQLAANNIRLTLKHPAEQPTQQADLTPFAMLNHLGFGLRIDQLHLNELTLQQANNEPLRFNTIQAAFVWRASQLDIKQLSVSHERYQLTSSGKVNIVSDSEFSGQLKNQLRGLMDDVIALNIDWHGNLQTLQLNTQLITPFVLNAEHQLTRQPDGFSLSSQWLSSENQLSDEWLFSLLNGQSRLDWINQQLRFNVTAQTQFNQGSTHQHDLSVQLQDMANIVFNWQVVSAKTGHISLNGESDLSQKTARIRLTTQALQLADFIDFDASLDTALVWTLTDFTNRQAGLDIEHFDLQGLPQALNIQGHLQSQFHSDNAQISLDVTKLKLNYGDYQGSLSAQLLANQTLTAFNLPQAELNLGQNRINLSAELAEQFQLNASANLLNLHQLWPRLAGNAQLTLALQGVSFDQVQTSLKLTGQQLRFDDLTLQKLELNANTSLDRLAATQFDLQLNELTLDNTNQSTPDTLFALNELQLNRRLHNQGLRTELQLQHPQFSLRAQADEANPSFTGGQISVNWLDIQNQHSGNWQLTAPWLIDWQTPNQITSNQACLDSRQHQHAKFCLQAFEDQRLTWSIQAWPIFSWLTPYLPQSISLNGLINGDGGLLWQTNWQFQQQFNSRQLDAIVQQQGYEWPLQINDWQVELNANKSELNLTHEAKVNQGGHLQARLKLTPNQAWSDADIDCHISLGLNELPLSEQAQELIKLHHNNLLIYSALSGQVNNLQHDTRANFEALFDLPLIGLEQQQIQLQAQLNEQQIQAQGLWKQNPNRQAQITLDLHNLQQQPRLNVQLKTDYINLLNTPFARLYSSADIDLFYQQQQLTLAGEMRVKDSHLNLGSIPLTQRSQLSQDEVIMDRQNQPVAETPTLEMGLNLTIQFAEQVKIKVRDAEAYLGGELKLEKSLSKPDMSGFGQVSLSNGQLQLDARNRIEIDPSFFNFNGSLSNPTLNVNLSRQVLQTQARLNITGTATQPQFVFYSTPHLSQGQIINLLIFGRAADLDQEPNYQSQVVSAFYKLGIQNNTPLLNQLTETLGIEDVYFDIRDQQTSNLIVGRALTDKLYIRYEMGLGGQQNKAVQMFYQLSPNWFIESQSGDQSRSLDLIFRKER